MSAAGLSVRPIPPWLLAGLAAAGALWLLPDTGLAREILRWLPYLEAGFVMNVLISVLAMALAPFRAVRLPALAYVQVFRNAPHLVLIFATTYVFPFEIVVGGYGVPFPDWLKVVFGLAIPASAHIA